MLRQNYFFARFAHESHAQSGLLINGDSRYVSLNNSKKLSWKRLGLLD
jgi:hypothetical protein